jgi:hypothetical protein
MTYNWTKRPKEKNLEEGGVDSLILGELDLMSCQETTNQKAA